jgi:hypothetical protein
MRRILVLTTLILSASAFAQTTIDITSQAPATTVCSYPTNRVTTGSTPGHLAAQLTGAPSGAGCTVAGGTLVSPVTFGPASPLALVGPSPIAGGATPTTPVAASFTAQPLNAVSCTAAIATTVGLGVGNLTNGATVCNSQATCSSGTALNIPATFTNPSTSATTTYSVTLTCTAASGANPLTTASNVTFIQNASGVVTTGPCSTVIPSSTSGIPNFTQLSGTQQVFYFSGGTQPVDVTNFDSIFQAPWPGNATATAVVTLPTNKYVSAKFHVPAGFMERYPTGVYGNYTINQSQFSTSVSFSISTTCGDFANPQTAPASSVVSGCWKNKQNTNGFVQWRKDVAPAGCVLHDDTDYYLNFINADVSAVQALSGSTAGGTASSTKNQNCGTGCTDPIANNPNSF